MAAPHGHLLMATSSMAPPHGSYCSLPLSLGTTLHRNGIEGRGALGMLPKQLMPLRWATPVPTTTLDEKSSSNRGYNFSIY